MTSDPILGKCQSCGGDLRRIRPLAVDRSAIQCDECDAKPTEHKPRYDGQLVAISGNSVHYMLVDRNLPNPCDVSKSLEVVELFCSPAIPMPPSVWAELRAMVENALLGRVGDLLRLVEHMTPSWYVLEDHDADPIESRMIVTVRWVVRGLARNCGTQPPAWLSNLEMRDVFEAPDDNSDTPECGCGEPTCLGTCGYLEEAEHVG